MSSKKEKQINKLIEWGLECCYQDNTGRALEIFHEVIATDPDGPKGYHYISGVLARLYRYEEALEYSDKAAARSSGWADIYFARGEILIHLDRPDEAIESLNKTMSLNPEDALVYINLGSAYIDKKEYFTALEFLDKGSKLDSDDEKINKEIDDMILYCKKQILIAAGRLKNKSES